MNYTPPGSPKLRALVESFIKKGSYPETRQFSRSEVDQWSPALKNKVIELVKLVDKEEGVAESDTPAIGSKWAKLREEIRDKVWAILEENNDLLQYEVVQLQAIEKGAIPDPNKEDSQMRYYRLPHWDFAHWECGTPIKVKHVAHSVHFKDGPGRGVGSGEVKDEDMPYCPTCEQEPAFHGAPVRVSF